MLNATAPHATTLRHWQTFDIEEHAQGPDGWSLRYDQLTAGRFAGHLSELSLDGLQLIRDRANQSMFKQGQSWPGSLSFSLPLAARDAAFHCAGHAIGEHCLLVARGDSLPELRTPGDLDLLCVAVDETLLAEPLHQQGHTFDLHALPRCYRLPPNHPGRLEFTQLVHSLLDEGNSQALLDHPAIRQSIRDAVLMHLLDLVDEDEVRPLPPSTRKRMVDRALEYALAQRDAPPSIVDLCNRVGASRRKLQYCFQETLGTNPQAYLRALRLNAVHRALLQGDQDSVQTAAANWGFWHLSRFATDYRQLFGERPSDTLRRTRHCVEFG